MITICCKDFTPVFTSVFTSVVTSVINSAVTSVSTKKIFLNFPPKFHSNTTSIFTSVFTPTLMMLSFYSTLKTTAEHLFTFQFPLTFHNNNTCNYSICKKSRFEKGIYCWNILSCCIGMIVDISPSYIFTQFSLHGWVCSVPIFFIQYLHKWEILGISDNV